MKLRISCLIFFALIPLAPASAQQVISYLASTPTVSFSSGFPAGPAQRLQIPAFDASLGTLTSVRLTLTAQISQIVRGENRGASATAYSYALTTSLTLAKGAGALFFAPAPAVAAGAGNLASFDGRADFAGPSGFSFNQAIARTDTRLETGAAMLADFTGAGLIDFSAAALANAIFGGAADFAGLGTSDVTMTLEVDYAYSPIPETSGYALMLGMTVLALLGAGRMRASFAERSGGKPPTSESGPMARGGAGMPH